MTAQDYCTQCNAPTQWPAVFMRCGTCAVINGQLPPTKYQPDHGITATREHVTDDSPCWCNSETSYTDPDTGASVIVHKEPQ